MAEALASDRVEHRYIWLHDSAILFLYYLKCALVIFISHFSFLHPNSPPRCNYAIAKNILNLIVASLNEEAHTRSTQEFPEYMPDQFSLCFSKNKDLMFLHPNTWNSP